MGAMDEVMQDGKFNSIKSILEKVIAHENNKIKEANDYKKNKQQQQKLDKPPKKPTTNLKSTPTPKPQVASTTPNLRKIQKLRPNPNPKQQNLNYLLDHQVPSKK